MEVHSSKRHMNEKLGEVDTMVEDILGKSTIFRDESKLDAAYVPQYLPHREGELKSLAEYFKGSISPAPVAQTVTLLGGIGTGKTMLSKRFGKSIEKAAARRGINLRYIHINCRKERTDYMIWASMAKELQPELELRGYPAEYVQRAVDELLVESNTILIVCLDEIDYYMSRDGKDIIYFLSRPLENHRLDSVARYSMVLISRDFSYYYKLDEPTRSSLKKNVIRFEKYNASQIFDILKYRTNEAFTEGAMSDDVIKFVSEIAAQTGDCRFALEMMFYAGMRADREGRVEVSFEDVRAAKAEVLPVVSETELRELNLHQKFTYLAAANLLGDSSSVLSGDIFSEYESLCEQHNEPARSYTSFASYLKDLGNLGFIEAKTEMGLKETGGMSTRVSIQDIPVEILSQKLDEIIREELSRPNYVSYRA
jgi:cell division control protein 6